MKNLFIKKHIQYTLGLLSFILLPCITYADSTITGNTATNKLTNPLKLELNSVGALVQNFAQIFSYVAIIAGVVMLIYVGLRFVLVQGDVAEMKKLKEWLLWIVIGIAIIIGARIIIQVVINTLASTGVVNENIINSANNALTGN